MALMMSSFLRPGSLYRTGGKLAAERGGRLSLAEGVDTVGTALAPKTIITCCVNYVMACFGVDTTSYKP